MEARGPDCAERTLLSCGWAYFMYRPRRAKFTPSPLWCDLTPAEWLTRKMGQNLHMQTATWLVSRTLTEAAGPWNTQLAVDDDGEYFCRVVLASDGVHFVPHAKVFYRMVGGSHLGYIGTSQRKVESQFMSMRLHIGYLLSLENSERTREACVSYLQTWLMTFYPDRPDIVKQAHDLAGTLDGHLQVPRLSWKYEWIRRLFGWGSAKRMRLLLPRVKWSVLRRWDQALSQMEALAPRRSSLAVDSDSVL
jgi:hypothetical protein